MGSILIVEDQEDMRQLLAQALEETGYQTIACADALEALAVLQSGKQICLILLDLMMPGITGFQFRAEQRADPELRDIPVIVMTGVSQPDDYQGNLHAVGYLPKPFRLDQIVTMVREHCGSPA